jgi:hypothetical protein
MKNQITTANTFNPLATVSRWIARIIGTLQVISIVIIAVGEGMPNPLSQTLEVQIGFLALALIMIGILVAWRWELAGGIISLAGWCLFVGSVIGIKRLNVFVSLLALPGILYLISAWLRRHNQRQIP